MIAFALAAAGFAGLCAWWALGGAVDLPWASSWGLRLRLELDGLARLYGLIATGVGVAVFAYAVAYLPGHLDETGVAKRRPAEIRFYGFMGLFVVSMVGLVTAQDLVLLFVFWDLTAICSYYLIAYDRHDEEARFSALMALLVTGATAVLLMLAIVLWWLELGTVSLPELESRVGDAGGAATTAAVLAAVAALAKSAQAPFHFWLARAMVAPTPVSAYLHAAAMVAAGVFLLARLHPLLAPVGPLLDVLVWVGFASIATGGVLAFTATRLKLILAYSTVSQYGYVVVMLGLGGTAGATAAAVYVLAHAIAKAALFLTAGAVTRATGREELDDLGGLARQMPLTAAASLAAAASVAGLPLTLGFFGDEKFFGTALEHGTGMAVAALAATVLTFAYMARFWGALFLGSGVARAKPIPRLLEWPIAALALLIVAGGVAPATAAHLGADAAATTLASPVSAVSLAYHADLRAENVLALSTLTLGTLVVGLRAQTARPLLAIVAAGRRFGPQRLYLLGLAALNRCSDALHDFEVRDLRFRVTAVLLPGAVLLGAAIVTTANLGDYAFGDLEVGDIGLVAALAAAVLAAVAVTLPRRHLTIVLLLAALGFSLALTYAFIGAPDVTLVAVIVEVLFGLLLVAVLALVPDEVLRREARLSGSRRRELRDLAVAAVASLFALAVVWGALSRPTPDAGVADEHVRLAEEAHADDAVTAILADFRALDTLAEITVVGVAVTAALTLLRRGHLW